MTLENYICVLFVIPTWRILVITALKKYRRSGYNFRNIIVIGKEERTTPELLQFFKEHPEHGYRVLKVFDEDKSNIIESVKEYASSNSIDEIYCMMHAFTSEELSELIQYCQNNLVRIHFVPRAEGFNYKRLKTMSYGLIPVLSLSTTPLDDIIHRAIKRFFDVTFSILICVLLLSWLTPILAILIKISSKGPVFFRQKRSGLNNNDFWCLKFRTMKMNKDSDQIQATKNDMRITRIGSFMRKTSLDELPQFFNVLWGDMSVIGPRPHMLKHTEEYSKLIDNYLRRHFIKPGITGLSQVKGYRGETEELYQMRNRIKIDIFYMENWSFWLDLKILFLTIWNVFRNEEKAY